jgi:flagellar biosynthesis protein FliR
MNVIDLVQADAFAFILILARMSAFLVAWPVFGGTNVPAIIKILFSLLLTLTLFPLLKAGAAVDIISWQQLIFYVVKEALVGLVIAYISYFFFYAVQIGSEIISISLGISAAQIFNPTMASQASPVDNFYYAVAVLFFLMINGHHIFLTGLVQSYDIIPVARWTIEAKSFTEVALVAKDIMGLGLQLAAPVLVSILLINIALAIVGRAVPQINVLVTSMPVNILVGLGVLIIAMPFALNQFGDGFEVLVEHFFRILKSI